MSRSSPATARRSLQLVSSPERTHRLSFLFDPRNDELSHLEALAAAQVEHDRVREAAIRVYELYELKVESDRIQAQQKKEQERLKAEAEIAAKEMKLQELRAKSIPKPVRPPEPKEEPQPEPPVKTVPSLPPKPPTTTTEQPAEQKSTSLSKPQTNGFGPSATPQSLPGPSAQNAPKPTVNSGSGITIPKSTPLPPQPQPSKSTDRYVQIHQELKKLRKSLQAEAKVPGSPLKGTMGVYRREIGACIGRLAPGKGANAEPTKRITSILLEALRQKVPSPLIDVSKFVVDSRQAVEGSANNDASLPALFIFLMNICAKGIINQFINEGSANPKAADPIGVFAAHLFSVPDFQWRGGSLIDILMAKFRVSCPALFGLHGNDKTERGRLALGWRKAGPGWISEQAHNDRMAGLAAGYAAVSLRDFSKSSKKNPYPPANYWKALAGIVNCPAGQTSNTQCVVVRSMIDGHEKRFLDFYGNAAVAALRLALVEFPKRAPDNASAAGALKTLVDTLKSEGLVLT